MGSAELTKISMLLMGSNNHMTQFKPTFTLYGQQGVFHASPELIHRFCWERGWGQVSFEI